MFPFSNRVINVPLSLAEAYMFSITREKLSLYPQEEVSPSIAKEVKWDVPESTSLIHHEAVSSPQILIAKYC